MNDSSDDSAIRFVVEEGGAIARLLIPWIVEPDTLDLDDVLERARGQELFLDEAVTERIERAVESFRGDRRDLDVVVAEGIATVDGENGRLEWVDEFDPSSADTAASPPDDASRVDYYNRIRYIRVPGGTHIATLHPSTKGENGRDVCGRSVTATPGRPCDAQIDSTLAVNGDGKIISKEDGVLEWSDGRMKVTRLFAVPGWVDFSTGNIDFDGTVTVRDGIREGFAVLTTEAIVVEGAVEPAKLRCEGNLSCRHGASGKDRGTLHVGGRADVGHLDFVGGAIRGDLIVRKEMIGCRLAIGGDLLADVATVMGGDITVLGSARVAQLGSARGRPTTLVLGQRGELLRLVRLARELEALRTGRAERGGAPPTRFTNARREKEAEHIAARIIELRQRLEWCLLQPPKANTDGSGGDGQDDAGRGDAPTPAPSNHASADGELTILRVLHPEVLLLFGGFELRTPKTLTGPLTIRWQDLEEPEITGAGGPARPLREVMEVRRPAA